MPSIQPEGTVANSSFQKTLKRAVKIRHNTSPPPTNISELILSISKCDFYTVSSSSASVTSMLCRLHNQFDCFARSCSPASVSSMVCRLHQQVCLLFYAVSISKCVFYAVPSVSKYDFYAVHLYQQVWLLCCAFLSASITSIANERSTWREKDRERKKKGKEEEGKEKGKGKLEVKLWQKRKKSQTPQPGIESGTPANAADALPLSHRDKRYHQPWCSLFWNFIRSASTSQHRHHPMPTVD